MLFTSTSSLSVETPEGQQLPHVRLEVRQAVIVACDPLEQRSRTKPAQNFKKFVLGVKAYVLNKKPGHEGGTCGKASTIFARLPIQIARKGLAWQSGHSLSIEKESRLRSRMFLA